MSKKGRSSVLLLGALVGCLLSIPLVFIANAARLDRTTLNKRIALLESRSIASPSALQAQYRADRLRMLPILPPDPDVRLNPSGGLVVFDTVNFAEWVEVLAPAELNGVTVYPVTVVCASSTLFVCRSFVLLCSAKWKAFGSARSLEQKCPTAGSSRYGGV